MQPGTDDVVESDVGKDNVVHWEVWPLPVRFKEAGVVEKYPCSGPIQLEILVLIRSHSIPVLHILDARIKSLRLGPYR